MANINKIKLSGQTYNIQDLNATKTVELTQAEYDALSPKDPNVFYIITDAQGADLSNYYTKTEADGLLDTKLDVTAYTPTDLSNYYTKSETSGATEISTALASKADTATTYTKTETDNAITAATSAKQDTLVSGTNIKTINSQSILGEGNITIEGGGGGGKAVSAGTNISITTGETADTINCTLPISAGTGSESIIAATQPNYPNKATANGAIAFNGYGLMATSATGINSIAQGDATSAQGRASHSEGYDTKAIGYASHSEGAGTSAMTDYSHAEGINTKATNKFEHASGRYNISVSASTTFGDSGNTLFSVGNGTAYNARHNAFEIRQNGDIYIADTNDTSTTNYYEKPMIRLQDALGGGGGTVDTEITSASTNPVTSAAIYNQFGGLKLVKLTQSEYDSLTTKDNSTLYVIVN